MANAQPAVVVFSIKECAHCRRAKALLQEQGLSYEDVSLTDYPEKRNDMLQLANRLTVPQIFVNGHYVGGASELTALHESGRLKELASGAAGPFAGDARLAKPDYAPKAVVEDVAPPEWTIVVGTESMEYPVIVNLLLQKVPVADKSCFFGLSKMKSVFAGSALIAFLTSEFKLSQEDATALANRFMGLGMFAPADGGSGFSMKGLFRFQAHEAGLDSALNLARKWCVEEGCVSDAVQNPMSLLKRLKGMFGKIVSDNMDDAGTVDYVAVGSCEAFLKFELAAAELQLVDLATLEPQPRRAFLMNLYNLLVLHGFAKVGIPNTDLTRVTYYDHVSYLLANEAGAPMSLSDIENGILRGNRTPPGHLYPPLGANSPHMAHVLPCDYRIHFGLNCGAKSCPPVKWFTAEALDEELRIVASAWVEQDENVKVDLGGKTLWLSKICSWYFKDFGSDKADVAKTLHQHARGKKEEDLKALLKGTFEIKYLPYDWSTNSRNALNFGKIRLGPLVGL